MSDPLAMTPEELSETLRHQAAFMATLVVRLEELGLVDSAQLIHDSEVFLAERTRQEAREEFWSVFRRKGEGDESGS